MGAGDIFSVVPLYEVRGGVVVGVLRAGVALLLLLLLMVLMMVVVLLRVAVHGVEAGGVAGVVVAAVGGGVVVGAAVFVGSGLHTVGVHLIKQLHYLKNY